jgi:type IV pilus assembly protein PilV
MFVNKHNSNLKVRRQQRGDTMIEILVTILVLAVGVLGVAAMQITTLKNLNSSHSASIASMLAEDFGERMRANSVGALANDYNHSAAPASVTNCVANECDPGDLAIYDMNSWWQSLNTNLPSATGQVTRTNGTDTFVITVRWDEDRSGSQGTNCPVESEADLDCYQLSVTL